MLPPGGKATRKVIGPVGNSCPKPWPPSATRAASAGAIRTARRASIVRFLAMPARLYAQSAGAQVAASNRISFCVALVALPCRAALKGRGFIGRLRYRPRLVRVRLVFLLGAASLACLRRRRQRQ